MQRSVLRSSPLLEQARFRLRRRFSEKWPASDAKLASKSETAVLPQINTQSFGCLEAARQRVRERFLAKWPDSNVRHISAETIGEAAHAPKFSELNHLEAARLRLRARFLSRWPNAKASTATKLDDFYEFEDELPEVPFCDATSLAGPWKQIEKHYITTPAAGQRQPSL